MTQSDKTEARRVAEALAKEFAYMARERACADAIHAALIAYGNARLEAAAEAMHPILRSMISRGNAAETIRSLKVTLP
jgi:hypothetical protein